MRHPDTSSLPLFDSTPVEVAHSTDRRRVIKRAFERADKWVRQVYVATLMQHAREHDTFGAWDITRVYVKNNGPLSETNRKALGGIFVDLLEKGVIVEAGIGKRPNGNRAAIYRLKR